MLSFLSPCVLPLFPSYLSLILGISFDDLNVRENIWKMVVFHSVSFTLGFSTGSVLLGASFSFEFGFYRIHPFVAMGENLAAPSCEYDKHTIGIEKTDSV